MLNMQYGYHLNDTDRELEIMATEYDLTMMRLNTLLETVDSTLKVNYAAAELKVLTESGTYSDLAVLYKEAANDANKTKAGIFQRIAQAISKMIEKLNNFIKTKILKQVEEQPQEFLDEQIEVPKGFAKFMQTLQDIANGIKNNIAKITSGAVSGYMLIDNALRGKLSDVLAKDVFDKGSGVVKVARSKAAEWLDILVKKILPILAPIGAVAAGFWSKIAGMFHKGKEDANKNDGNKDDRSLATTNDNSTSSTQSSSETITIQGVTISNDNPALQTIQIAQKLTEVANTATQHLNTYLALPPHNPENDEESGESPKRAAEPKEENSTGKRASGEVTDNSSPGKRAKNNDNEEVEESVDDLLDLFGLSVDDLSMFNESTDEVTDELFDAFASL